MPYRLYASSVCDMNSTAAAAVYGLWHYTSVICLLPLLMFNQINSAVKVLLFCLKTRKLLIYVLLY